MFNTASITNVSFILLCIFFFTFSIYIKLMCKNIKSCILVRVHLFISHLAACSVWTGPEVGMRKCRNALNSWLRPYSYQRPHPKPSLHNSKPALHKRMVVRLFQKHKDQED